ncbi:hypothetical protein TELCIR_08715, partial [Teladorsagia circumcincta]
MGNRSTIEQRSAAGTDVTKNSKSSKPPSTVPSSSGAESTTGGSYTDNGVCSSETESNMEEDSQLRYNRL